MVKLLLTVSGGTEVLLTAVRCVGVRRYADVSCRYDGGTVADQVARWWTRWHGGAQSVTVYGGFTVMNQVARSCHGAALGGTQGLTATRLRHMCGRWHGWIMCQVARCDGGSVTRSPYYLSARRDGGKMNRLHGDVVVTK